jgi:hypothetical protein
LKIDFALSNPSCPFNKRIETSKLDAPGGERK